MLSVDTRGGAIALFVVALLLLGARDPHMQSYMRHCVHNMNLLRSFHALIDALHARESTSQFHVFTLAGTWGALLNLAERKGRHTAHTWMDFSIGFFLVSLVCGL